LKSGKNEVFVLAGGLFSAMRQRTLFSLLFSDVISSPSLSSAVFGFYILIR
jgi:hypothetical protein